MSDKEYYGSLLWLPVQLCSSPRFPRFLSIALMGSYSPNPHLDRYTVLHLNIHQNQLKNFFCINMEENYVNYCHLYWSMQIYFFTH